MGRSNQNNCQPTSRNQQQITNLGFIARKLLKTGEFDEVLFSHRLERDPSFKTAVDSFIEAKEGLVCQGIMQPPNIQKGAKREGFGGYSEEQIQSLIIYIKVCRDLAEQINAAIRRLQQDQKSKRRPPIRQAPKG